MILLDTGPLGLLANPKETEPTLRCQAWLQRTVEAGTDVLVPEIADYELRRELIRAGRSKGIDRLDELGFRIGYLLIDTEVWRRAAELWARARTLGVPTADAKGLDGDVILAAQAQLVAEGGFEVMVATTNVGHLGRYIDARSWEDLEP